MKIDSENSSISTVLVTTLNSSLFPSPFGVNAFGKKTFINSTGVEKTIYDESSPMQPAGGTFRISKTKFRKNFSVEGEIDYEAKEYNI